MPENSSLSPIAWSVDNGFLILTLISLIQEKENFIVLFGKKDPRENTSGERNITVYSRIAQAMLPDDYKEHHKTLTTRIKSKVEEYGYFYPSHPKPYLKISGCVKSTKTKPLCFARLGVVSVLWRMPSWTGSHHYLDYYILYDGPHHDIPEAAKNIWGVEVNLQRSEVRSKEVEVKVKAKSYLLIQNQVFWVCTYAIVE
ncbi:hypothetical protein B0H14DRAFT_2615545 [Mycena olivaceomarginata]|nr:hypothetical protein B0H14DRAFT_2615545 [Mycena olivaceomarginata]